MQQNKEKDLIIFLLELFSNTQILAKINETKIPTE